MIVSHVVRMWGHTQALEGQQKADKPHALNYYIIFGEEW